MINYLIMANQFELMQTIYQEISDRFQNDQSAVVGYYVGKFEAGWFTKAALYSKLMHILMLVIVVLTVIFDGRK